MKLKTVAPIVDDIRKVERLDQIVQNIRYASRSLELGFYDLVNLIYERDEGNDWNDEKEEFLEDVIGDANFDINRIIDNANKIKEALPDED